MNKVQKRMKAIDARLQSESSVLFITCLYNSVHPVTLTQTDELMMDSFSLHEPSSPSAKLSQA